MEKIVTWVKGVFESSYQIFCNNQICGSLVFETWNNNAFGIMPKNNYIFKANGFTNLTTAIFDEKGEQLGFITFQIWQLKAVVTLKSQPSFSWQYTNSWLSEWNINNQGVKLNYKAGKGNGVVTGGDLEDELTLITGIYVKEFFSRIMVAVIGFIVLMVLFKRF